MPTTTAQQIFQNVSILSAFNRVFNCLVAEITRFALQKFPLQRKSATIRSAAQFYRGRDMNPVKLKINPMKTLLLLSALASLSVLTGCTSTGFSSNTGGIDPVTMAGIDDSNRATQEAADRQFNETQQMINTQNMIDTQNMVNEQNAAAAAAMSQP